MFQQSYRSSPVAFANSRHGISLLEVLVSMFILLFGLVGVASLFPVGKYHVQQAVQYDRAAAVGQRAFEEIRVRGLLNPNRWNLVNGTRFTDPANGTWRTKAVFFDPLAVATSGVSANVPAGNTSTLQRVTWRMGAGGNMSLPSAEQIFKSHEDLSFELPALRTTPPIQRINAVEREHDAAYSWGFMAIPIANPGSAGSTTAVMGESCYLVSVVVFRNRRPGAEWGSLNVADGISNHVNEGRVKVTGTATQAGNLKIGEWVLLSLQSQPNRPNYFVWNKIISLSIGGTGSSLNSGQLQVQGPARSSGLDNSVWTTVFGSAVGVYEQIMFADSGSDWLQE